MSNPYRSISILDWIAAGLRWLALLGMALALGWGDSLTVAAIVTLLVAAMVYISLSLLTALGQPPPYHRYWGLAVDLAIVSLLFYLSRAQFGGLGWAIILPGAMASLYFGAVVGSLVALFALGLQSAIVLASSDLLTTLIFLAGILPLMIASVVSMGIASQRLRVSESRQSSMGKQSPRSETEQREVIFKLVSELSSTLNYQRVLETALDLSLDILTGRDGHQPRMVCAVFLYTQNLSGKTELRVGSARGFTPSDLRVTLEGTEGLIARAIDSGVSQLQTEGISQDPELGRVIALRACQSAYCIPLYSGLDTYGVLLFSHPSNDYFSPERCEILDMIGKQSIIAIQNARLYHDLELEKERIMEIQQNTRNKLARDLHDGPTQALAAIAMRVNYARRMIERDPKAASGELFKIEELARRTTTEIRHMLFTLRPLVLESQGLVSALEAMAEKTRETYNQDVSVRVDPEIVARLEPSRQGVVFYIAEEAVNNARKHARAEHIWVRLLPGGEDLALLEIEDDGVGFDANTVDANYESRGSLGMLTMRERADLVNGYLEIDSTPGKGTRIAVIIPLTEGAVERARRAH